MLLLVAGVSACSPESAPEPEPEPEQASAPTFIGSEQCAACHEDEYRQWQGSHHQLAMQVADANSVQGDFDNRSVPHGDADARFFTKGERYFAELPGADGTPDEFEITHTFGTYPLQQYLVDLPGGRKQALQFAWDSRDEQSGGQRWYHLYADEQIAPDDPLHWTGRLFNWNYMCAECHSTNVELGYDLESDSFTTTFDEVSVGCEACHGPGSRHLSQAHDDAFDARLGLPISFKERDGVSWVMNADTGIAERSEPNVTRQETEACGRCHARRSPVAADYEYGVALADTHMPSLLEAGLYHADGRIQDEVYVYGSFLQSKMYAAGVTCSDCHEPHSGQLRAGPEPNDTCATCHLPARFATAEHSPEQVGECVACHMQTETYMGVDDRRDHSFRLPDTDTDPNHYGAVIAAGRELRAVDSLLRGVANPDYPGIARATMLTLLPELGETSDRSLLQQQLDAPDPLVRIGALRALRQQPPELRLETGSQLLRDPVRSVRVEAALTYAEYRDLLPLDDNRAFGNAADEYRQSLSNAASSPQAALGLAEFETRLGNTTTASELYKHALKIGPNVGSVNHAYGLSLVRSGQTSEALAFFERAVENDPQSSEFVYVYGVALNSLGQPAEAVAVLEDARVRFPDNYDIGWALATMYRDRGEIASALTVADQLREQYPEDEQVRILIQSLRR